jgi:hypothetical protein
VQGQPIGQAPLPTVKPILDAMASHGMTIEPLPAPRLTRDEGTGLIEAASDGFRILLQSPNGDAKLEMVFGRALARAGAVRAVDDTPLDLSAGIGQPVSGDPAPGAEPRSAAAPAPASLFGGEAAVPVIADAARVARTASAFTAFDPVAGSVAPSPEAVPSAGTGAEVAAPAPPPLPAQLSARPVALARDLSSRVLTAYLAFAGVIGAGVVFGLRRRPRPFGG